MRNVHLISLRFCDDAKNWSSPKFDFSPNAFTIFHAENGAGKSPILNGLVYALGFSRKLNTKISDNVGSIELEISVDSDVYLFKRYISDKFYCKVSKNDIELETYIGKYANPNDRFNTFLFELFDLPRVALTTSSKKVEDRKATKFYISQLVPLFYISQRDGWISAYVPLDGENWIMLQQAEAVRLFLGMEARYPFLVDDIKNALFDKRRSISEKIQTLSSKIESHRSLLGKHINLPKKELLEIRESKENIIRALKDSTSGVSSFNEVLQRQIEEANEGVKRLSKDIYKLKIKISTLESFATELMNKVKVHEDSFDMELAFEVFCGEPQCSLFQERKIPFGKKMLYLLDQYKDVDQKVDALKDQLKRLVEKRDENQKRLDALLTSVNDQVEGKEFELLRVNVDELVKYNEIISISDAYEIYKNKQTEANNEFLEIQKKIDSFAKGNKKLSDEDNEKRAFFQSAFKHWLSILSTINLDIDSVRLEGDMTFNINEQSFSKSSEEDGSTRTRIILAFHAALLETSLAHDGNHPPFLIIDTPSKDEANKLHLAAFFEELRRLGDRYKKKIQMIVAYKDAVIVPTTDDVVHEPTFTNEKGELHYLG